MKSRLHEVGESLRGWGKEGGKVLACSEIQEGSRSVDGGPWLQELPLSPVARSLAWNEPKPVNVWLLEDGSVWWGEEAAGGSKWVHRGVASDAVDGEG